MKNELSDKEVIRILKQKANSCNADADKLEKEAAELRDKAKTFEKTIVNLGGSISLAKTNTDKISKTFSQIIKEIFSDNRPRTSRQLYVDYCKINPNNKINDFYSFSGRFSNIMKTAGINKHKVPENPLPTRFIYGFKEWFDGERLKNEYFTNVDFKK